MTPADRLRLEWAVVDVDALIVRVADIEGADIADNILIACEDLEASSEWQAALSAYDGDTSNADSVLESGIAAGIIVLAATRAAAAQALPVALAPISKRQFFQALASSPYSLITTSEALDAVRTGAIPAVMQAVIDTLPADQQFAASMLIAGAATFQRDNPLVEVFGASQGMDAVAIDAFWLAAAAL